MLLQSAELFKKETESNFTFVFLYLEDCKQSLSFPSKAFIVNKDT